MTEPPTWYTDDITLYSYGTLLRMSFRQGVISGPLIFLFFVFRKAIGWRFRAAYGTRRLDKLPVIGSDQLPNNVRDATAPAIAACRDAGFNICYVLKSKYIGARLIYSVVMLGPDGRTSAAAMWVRNTVGQATREGATLSCNSIASGGIQLTTGGVEASVDKSLVMPDHDLMALPLDTLPFDVLAAHRERIAHRSDLVRFDCDTLADYALNNAQRHFDWRMEQGHLVPLTPGEVRRLGGEQV